MEAIPQQPDDVDLELHSLSGKPAPPARHYIIRVDDERVRVDTPEISGRQILDLVNKCPDSHLLLQLVRRRDEIGLEEMVNVRAPGVERFVTFFKLYIEGKLFPWPNPTITAEQVAALGGWNVSEGVIQVDGDQNETTLTPGTPVELRPECSFGKGLRWKRG